MDHSPPNSNAGSDSEDLEDVPFDVNDVNPYEILQLERSADQKQIRKAYYAAAVKNHPDKVSEADKDAATERFQKIQFAYTILSDPQRKERYDRTGSTREATELGDDDFNWKDFFSSLNDTVNSDAINAFKTEYQGSAEETTDLLAAYVKCKGRMDDIYEHVMVSNVLDDDTRFRAILDAAIADGKLPQHKAYTQESASSVKKRTKRARDEATEAEAYAKELNLPSSFFGGKDENEATGKTSKSKNTSKAARKAQKSDDTLALLIQQRQQNRKQNFFDALEAKYATPKAERGKQAGGRKKRAVEVDEPPEEAFARNAKKKPKTAG